MSVHGTYMLQIAHKLIKQSMCVTYVSYTYDMHRVDENPHMYVHVFKMRMHVLRMYCFTQVTEQRM